MTSSVLTKNSTAMALNAVLQEEMQINKRLSMTQLLFGSGVPGLFSEDKLYKEATKDVSPVLKKLIDEFQEKKKELKAFIEDEQTAIEDRVDELTGKLLKELGLEPKLSTRKRRRPAWLCYLQHERRGLCHVAVLAISNVFLNKDGTVRSLYLHVSENDDGSSDSWTLGRRGTHGSLYVLEHIDF